MKTVSIRDWIDQNGVSYRKLKDPENVTYSIPFFVDESTKNIFSELKREKTTDVKFVARLENFHVNGDSGVVLRDAFAIKEFFCEQRIYKLQGSEHHKNIIHLADSWGGTNYWHWMTTCLSRLLMLKEHGENIKGYRYLVNSIGNRFVFEPLMMLGVDKNTCLELDVLKNVFCKSLIIPSKMKDIDPDGVLLLRKAFRGKAKVGSVKRIYIKRSVCRKVINENEVCSFLEKNGFSTISCEKLSFSEQLSLFSGANVIVAPHGAGLTNAMFSEDGTKVIEMRSPKHLGTCYYRMCNHLGFSYCSLYGMGKHPNKLSEIEKDINADMAIDVKKIKDAFDLMGIK